MHQLFGSSKIAIIRVFFFLLLLLGTGFLYKESHIIADALYFAFVLAVFMKFLSVKLYR